MLLKHDCVTVEINMNVLQLKIFTDYTNVLIDTIKIAKKKKKKNCLDVFVIYLLLKKKKKKIKKTKH